MLLRWLASLSSKRFLQKSTAIVAIVVLSLSQVRAQDLDEAIDEELDSTTQLDPGDGDMDKADDLEELELDDDTPATKQSNTPQATPAPSAQSNDKDLDELDLDDGLESDTPVVAEPEPTLDEPGETEPQPLVEEPIIDEPGIDEPTSPEPPPLIAKEPPPPVRDDLFDPPNAAYEKRLHQLVKGVRSTDDTSWEEVVGERMTELYPVQPGDTLWDISQTFFGDGFFWGKLWSENGTIENPHNISKGSALKFVAGSEGEPPAIGVGKTKEAAKAVGNGIFKTTTNEKPSYREDVIGDITQEEVESGIALETSEIIPAPSLPPASKRVPLLKVIPPSFITKTDPAEAGFDASGIKGAPAIRANEPATVILRSYAADREPESLGIVDEIEASERYAGTGQTVIVRLKRDITIGTRVTFIQLRPRPSGAPGPIVDVRGVGTITGVVNENKNAYRALVTTALDPVERDSWVLEEPPPTATYTKDGPRAEADVKVLGGEFDNERRVMGIGAVIYLSGGAKAGLLNGEILGVQSKRDTRFTDTRYPNATIPIATVRVVDVRERVATAIVLENGEYIAIGDRTSGEMPAEKPEIVTESATDATTFDKRKADEVELE